MEIPKVESAEYVHRNAGDEVDSPAWRYSLVEEIRLSVSFGEVLCVRALSTVGSACCGAGEVRYFMIPGRIVSWRSGFNEKGLSTSRVCAVFDDSERDEIVSALAVRYPGCQVCF